MDRELDQSDLRALPQGCQVERQYSEDDWARFLSCARRCFDSGVGLHNEFYAKIAEHEVTDAEVRRTIRRSARLVAYDHDGRGRVAMWDERVGVFVVATEAEGLILNAFQVEDIRSYLGRGSMDNIRWLKP
jgi:hypothetical protein